MRTRTLGIVAFCLASCLNTNHLVITTSAIDDRTPGDTGDDFDVEHVSVDAYTSQKNGFYAVRDVGDWTSIWDARQGAPPVPNLPANVDLKKRMLIVAVAPTDHARSIEIQKVTRTFAGLQVYVLETLPPKSCAILPEKTRPMDIVAVDRIIDDVHIHHDRVHADSCGPPPDAVAVCRIAGSGAAGDEKITASPGDTIDCDSNHSKPQIGKITDRSWQLLSMPPGSTTKLAVSKDNVGVTFPVDAWGNYSVSLNVRDATRDGSGMAIVRVTPPEGGIELYAARAEGAPRTELHVVELPWNLGTAGDCSLQSSKSWCDIHTAVGLQQAVLHGESNKRYRVVVKYLDERVPGGVTMCVRAFAKGTAANTCDEDGKARKANTSWDLGAFDPQHGTFYDARLPKPPVVVVHVADAGAPIDPSLIAPSMGSDAGILEL